RSEMRSGADECGSAGARTPAQASTAGRRRIEIDDRGPIDAPRIEIAILDADIDMVANGRVQTGDRLPGELAGAAAEFLDVGVAGTGAGIESKPLHRTDVDKAVDHPGEDAGVAVYVEIAGGEAVAGRRVARAE